MKGWISLMATMENYMLKTREILDIAKDKTDLLIFKTRLKLTIAENEKKLAATFEGIGRLVYDADQSGEDITEMLDEALATAKELQERVNKLQAKLYELNDLTCCAACGVPNDTDAVYCKKCGKPL